MPRIELTSSFLASPATALSTDTITCTTPFFVSGHGSAVFSLWRHTYPPAPTSLSSPAPASTVDHSISGNADVGDAWGLVRQAFMAQGTSTVNFGGTPALLGGTLNGAIRGNAPITLQGADFGFQDMSPRVRVCICIVCVCVCGKRQECALTGVCVWRSNRPLLTLCRSLLPVYRHVYVLPIIVCG